MKYHHHHHHYHRHHIIILNLCKQILVDKSTTLAVHAETDLLLGIFWKNRFPVTLEIFLKAIPSYKSHSVVKILNRKSWHDCLSWHCIPHNEAVCTVKDWEGTSSIPPSKRRGTIFQTSKKNHWFKFINSQSNHSFLFIFFNLEAHLNKLNNRLTKY